MMLELRSSFLCHFYSAHPRHLYNRDNNTISEAKLGCISKKLKRFLTRHTQIDLIVYINANRFHYDSEACQVEFLIIIKKDPVVVLGLQIHVTICKFIQVNCLLQSICLNLIYIQKIVF